MDKYTVEIVNCTRENALTNKEVVKFKHLEGGIALDKATDNGGTVVIIPDYAVELNIHNPKSKDSVDYTKYCIVDKNGDVYTTGSEGFWEKFIDIHCDMCEEEYSLMVFKKPCANRSGEYLTCSIM